MSQELTSVEQGSQHQPRAASPARPSRASSSEGGEQGGVEAVSPLVHTKSVNRDKVGPSEPARTIAHANRMHRLGIAKERSEQCTDWAIANLPADDRGRHDAMQQKECGSWLWFRRFTAGPTAGDTRLTGGLFCQKLTCPACMIRKAARTVDAYAPKVLSAWSAGAPDRRALFVTLTVKNLPDLATTWDNLKIALDKFALVIRQQRRRGVGPLAGLAGGVLHVETKRGKGGLWHPHVHACWLFDGRADYKALQAAWSQAVGYKAVSLFRHLKTQQLLLSGVELSPEQIEAMLYKEIQEVLKYPMKFEGGKPADIWHVAKVLYKRRRLRAFGCLVGVEVNEELADDQPDWSAWPSVELVYRYAGKGLYRQTRKPGPVAALEAWQQANCS